MPSRLTARAGSAPPDRYLFAGNLQPAPGVERIVHDGLRRQVGLIIGQDEPESSGYRLQAWRDLIIVHIGGEVVCADDLRQPSQGGVGQFVLRQDGFERALPCMVPELDTWHIEGNGSRLLGEPAHLALGDKEELSCGPSVSMICWTPTAYDLV